VITEAGYNSFLDAYHSKVPTIFIPFHTEQEDEQMTRLTLLQAHLWSQILKPDELTPDTLSHSIDQALNQQRRYPMIDLNGLENSKKILNEYLEKN
jgi:predicted glycosyltransferase